MSTVEYVRVRKSTNWPKIAGALACCAAVPLMFFEAYGTFWFLFFGGLVSFIVGRFRD